MAEQGTTPAQVPAHEGFRRKDLVLSLASRVASAAEGLGPLRLMHVCGTHERAINRFGLRGFLPPNVKVIAGPGCPVCVCPVSDILAARELSLKSGVTLASFGDMMAVPTPKGSLQDARSEGASLRIVYSAADALQLARERPELEVVFFSVGFETTFAATAAIVASLEARPQPNFSLLVSNRVVPEALDCLLSMPGLSVDGFILPGHVSVIIGSDAYLHIARDRKVPCAVVGFESVDLVEGILDLLQQIRSGEARVANPYSRVVAAGGNTKAKGLISKAFEPCDAAWRGLGILPGTGLRLRPAFARYDAHVKFGISTPQESGEDEPPSSCLCPQVMTGQAEPSDCPNFGVSCLPGSPVGPCMVSDEGSCRIRLEFGGEA